MRIAIHEAPRSWSRLAAAALFMATSWLSPAQAQDIEVETWARLLLAHPAEATGNIDGLLSTWLGLVDAESDHPLVEATLLRVGRLQSSARDPRAVADALLAIEPEWLDVGARRVLVRLQTQARQRFEAVEDLPTDHYPEILSHYSKLAPMGPLGDGRGVTTDSPLFADPGWGETHAGVAGELRWQNQPRGPGMISFSPAAWTHPGSGRAFSALRFDVPEGGAAWLEFDLGSSGTMLSAYRVRDPSYAWSLNGEVPVRVDLLTRNVPALSHRAVRLRAGRNQLVIQTSLDLAFSFSVRVLGPDGLPLPGLVEADDVAPLGAAVSGASLEALGPRPYETSESYLSALGPAGREPYAEALLGWLKLRDRRVPEGLDHLRRAYEALPADVGLRALLAAETGSARYLPTVWRRSTARTLAEQVLAADEHHLGAGLALAEILADEDREEEAIELLLELSEACPSQTRSLLLLRNIYGDMGMDAAAEEVLGQALARSPEQPAVLKAMAKHLDDVGQSRRALDFHRRLLEQTGRSSHAVRSLAKLCEAAGLFEEAEALHREALARAGQPTIGSDLAQLLVRRGRYEEADAVLREGEALMPSLAQTHAARADVALRAGDGAAELEQLTLAAELDPYQRKYRQRIVELKGEDETLKLFEAWRIDGQAVLADYDGEGYDESVVHLLDTRVTKIFPDGTRESIEHHLHQVRDLVGCEAQGQQRLQGDVLAVRTLKAAEDLRVYEPVKVSGHYVMPQLEPGDFVETVYRSLSQGPSDQILRPGSWFFQSTDKPVLLSRYVVEVPKSLPLRLVMRNFEGTHETHDEGDRVVHVFETNNMDRVLTEPMSPPTAWYLPWVEFGVDVDLEASLSWLGLETILPTRVTPEVRRLADEVLDDLPEGARGEEAAARALLARVTSHIDQWQSWSRNSATETLLSREGNPSYFYGALLSAAGIENELVWCRNQAPDGDNDPDPAFVNGGRWRGKQLVRVKPDDGAEVFCDLTMRDFPYGVLADDQPGAPAWAVTTGEQLTLPELPLSQRAPGIHADLVYRVQDDLSAEVEFGLNVVGGLGYQFKEQAREVPETMRKLAVGAILAQLIPGIDVTGFELLGLDDEQPLSVTVTGTFPSFLDEDGGALVCKLPFPALELSANLAGEGERTLPFFFPSAFVHSATARLELPESLQLVDPPLPLHEQLGPSRYSLDVSEDDDGAWTVRRELLTPPLIVAAEDFHQLEDACARIDEAERSRLKFSRR